MRSWLLVLCLAACGEPEDPTKKMIAEIEHDLREIEAHLIFFEVEEARFKMRMGQHERHKEEIVAALLKRRIPPCRVIRGPYRCRDLWNPPLLVGSSPRRDR